MKKIYNSRYHLVILFFAITASILTSCKKDNNSGAAPVITKIRAINPAPNDSTLTKVGPGQNIVIQGSNLITVQAVYFSGVAATFNTALAADNNLAITVPSVAFNSIAAGQANTIRLVTKYGEVTYKFPISPPPPVITGVSNEYTAPGQTLTIYGQYLYLISSITFTGGGSTGTNIVAAADGSSCTVTIPANATAGNIVVKTQGGTATYISYNDAVTGMACNFDNIFTYQYYSGNLTNSSALFPGNSGNYVELSTTGMSPYDFGWYNGGRSINLNAVQWVPVANLADPVENWALKFEISVKAPWKDGSLMIRRDENGDWGYVARYEPWKTATGNIYQTNGWVTVIIPLTQFKLPAAGGVNGLGNSAPDLPTLLNTMGSASSSSGNSQGKRGVSIMMINDAATAGTAIDLAIDNIRFVKIK